MINEMYETYRKFGRFSRFSIEQLKLIADDDRNTFLQEASGKYKNPRYESDSFKYEFGQILYHSNRYSGNCVLLYNYYTYNNGYRNYNRRVLVLTGEYYGRVISIGLSVPVQVGTVLEEVPKVLRNDERRPS